MANNKIKVVQLITTMADGGAETLVKDYALLADRDKVDMTVIAWSEPLGSANEARLKESDAKVIFLGEKAVTNPTKNILVKIARRIGKYYRFRRYIIDNGIDVIHVHLKFGLYLRALPRKELKRIKLFYTVHNEPDKFFNPKGKGRKKREYKEAKRLVDNYGLTLIALHKEMERAVCDLFHTDRVVTINNGINLDKFDRNLYNREAIRKSLGIEDDVVLLGHVGSFTKQKNHELLIDIYEEYRKKNSKSKLLLVGKGVLKEQVIQNVNKRGLQDEVIFLENRSDIPALMCAMDVFVFPSRWEGFPIVLIEAQAMGLRCVVSDRITKDAILTDNVSVVGIDDSVDSWIEAIDIKSIKDNDSLKVDDFDIRKIVEVLIAMYRK